MARALIAGALVALAFLGCGGDDGPRAVTLQVAGNPEELAAYPACPPAR